MSKLCRIPFIRSVFWFLAISLGAAQTWSIRHSIFSDGIAYLDIASAYLRGDWTNAINPYWSPLYSWLLAAAFLVIRPAPYWQVAVLHTVNFAAFLASCAAMEFFLRELVRYTETVPASPREGTPLSPRVIYIAGYCAILFAGLSIVSMWYCSPDMIALALMVTLAGLLIRIQRCGASVWTSVLIGLVSGLFFLARTAFAPSFIVLAVAVIAILYFKRQPVVRPALLMVGCALLLAGPFVGAISRQVGRFTIGESGSLNYGWEVDGASRYAHWQGEPYDIGSPRHPTKMVASSPKTYVFAQPIAGTYSPWFNPAYWYEGIHPKLKLRSQLKVLLVNLSVTANLFVRSPLALPALLLLLVAGIRASSARLSRQWPLLSLAAFGIVMYCFVYIEKRYIAGNLVILWMALAASIRTTDRRLQVWAPRLLVVSALVYTSIFVVRRQSGPVLGALKDLVHRSEKDWNVDYELARHLREAGLKEGDKVAYIGPSVDAEWARLAHVRIVAEIPLTYDRNQLFLNNTLRDRSDDIKKFWEIDERKRQEILQDFRNAGAKMVVTDGYYDRDFVAGWKRVLPLNDKHLPKGDPDVPSQLNSRYLDLTGTGAVSSQSANVLTAQRSGIR